MFVKIMYFNLGMGIIKYQHLSQFLSVSAILKSVVDKQTGFLNFFVSHKDFPKKFQRVGVRSCEHKKLVLFGWLMIAFVASMI